MAVTFDTIGALGNRQGSKYRKVIEEEVKTTRKLCIKGVYSLIPITSTQNPIWKVFNPDSQGGMKLAVITCLGLMGLLQISQAKASPPPIVPGN